MDKRSVRRFRITSNVMTYFSHCSGNFKREKMTHHGMTLCSGNYAEVEFSIAVVKLYNFIVEDNLLKLDKTEMQDSCYLQ